MNLILGFFLFITVIVVGEAEETSEECFKDRTHSFEVEADTTFSLSAEINELGGLVIDINYEDMKSDRIKLSSKESYGLMYNGIKHIKTQLNSLINEGWQNLDFIVVNNSLNVICTSSQMFPLEISLRPGIKSIKVSSENLKICEESCNIEKNIQKIINNEERFEITSFTTSTYPITFEIRSSVDEGEIVYFEMKPSNCLFNWKETNISVPCGHINSGWNKFDIYVNRTTLAINNHFIPVDFSLKTISISGNYLVNCTKGTPAWKISKEDEILIPIATGQEIGFIITSTVKFSPVFDFDGIKMTLKWNNGLKFDSSGQLLKPKRYYIIFEARSELLKLYSEKREDVLMELNIKKVPEFIRFSSIKGEYRLALSVEDPLHQPTEPAIVTGSPSTSTTLHPIAITLLVITPIAIIVILMITLKKIKKANENQECADKLGVDYTSIDTCATTVEGQILLHDLGEKQDQIAPGLDYVPWVIINDVTNNPSDALFLEASAKDLSSYQNSGEDGDLRKRNRPNQEKVLYEAVISGDYNRFHEAMKLGTGMNYKEPNNDETPLHAACWIGNLHFVQELLQKGADKENRTSLGMTALQAACDKGHLDIVQKLLSANANPNTTDNYGVTPLVVARREGHKEVETVILQAVAKAKV